MKNYDVEVVGAKGNKQKKNAVRQSAGRLRNGLRFLLKRPFLLGMVFLAGCALFYGTPHIGWDYQCHHPMRPGQSCRSVFYCAYYGIQGRREVFPASGDNCRAVTFLTPDWSEIF
ncbi:hypothetical protein [Sneathiella sp.]|uniref:hypothetical protein n=1 Tax=Sneathiella sp. TaxID=1964365 RepID=UPI002637578E|nr:hypothetical protein [Sneathiella sp.]MDF2365630.1 hypothetical protein [Sneathiella sp.]